MKPIGSEKIANLDDKLSRIRQIAGITSNSNSEATINENVNPNATVLFKSTTSDGDEYAIVQEEKYIYLKKKVNEKYEYMSGIENLKEFSFKTYTDALKHLNLMHKEINESTGTIEGTDFFKKKA